MSALSRIKLTELARLRAENERLQAALVVANHKIEKLEIAAKNHGKIAVEYRAEIECLQAALRDTKQALLDDRLDAGRALVAGIAVIDKALSGKGES